MSTFNIVSRGIVAENLVAGSHVVEIWPMELLPMAEGEVTSGVTTVDSEGVDSNGEAYQVKADIGMTVPCTWFGGGNLITPPNVRRGERVDILQQGDSQNYFWKSASLDQNLRRLETMVWVFSGNPDNADQDAPSPDNSYFLEVSTHKGLVTFATSQLNSEQAAFTFQLNTAKGTVTFKDEKGNSSFFDSVNTLLRILNVDGTFFEMNKKNISMYAEEVIDVKCDTLEVLAETLINIKTKKTVLNSTNSIEFNTKEFMMDASKSIVLNTKSTTLTSADLISFSTKDFTLDASVSVGISTMAFTLDTTQTDITSPVFNVTGSVMVTGPVTASGPLIAAALAVAGGAGAMTGAGELSVAAVESLAPVEAPGANFTGPVNAPAVLIGGVPVKPGPWAT